MVKVVIFIKYFKLVDGDYKVVASNYSSNTDLKWLIEDSISDNILKKRILKDYFNGEYDYLLDLFGYENVKIDNLYLKDIVINYINKSEQRKKSSSSRIKKKYFDIVHANKFSYFITITFKQDIEIEKINNVLKRIVQKSKRKKYTFEYLCVYEYTKKGRVHLHMLVNSTYIDTLKFSSKNNKSKSNEHKKKENDLSNYFKTGFVDVKKIDTNEDSLKISCYMAKYMLKNVGLNNSVNDYKNSYRYSRSLIIPKYVDVKIPTKKVVSSYDNKLYEFEELKFNKVEISKNIYKVKEEDLKKYFNDNDISKDKNGSPLIF